MRTLLISLTLLCGIVGCSTARSRTYDVEVKNETAKDLTVWLAKDGPPYEDRWASPEDLAIERPGGSDAYWGIVIPPGKTGYTGEIKGKFDEGTSAWLRVYSSVEKLSDLLAVNRGSPNRLDLELREGKNDFVITDAAGRLTAQSKP